MKQYPSVRDLVRSVYGEAWKGDEKESFSKSKVSHRKKERNLLNALKAAEEQIGIEKVKCPNPDWE